jgi:N-acetylglucosamine kinase-like BadF-type ATPase
MKTPTELEEEFKLKISKLPEILKELYEKPITPTKEEMCEKLQTLAEAGDRIAQELFTETCEKT